jgi:hypothetical protein
LFAGRHPLVVPGHEFRKFVRDLLPDVPILLRLLSGQPSTAGDAS